MAASRWMVTRWRVTTERHNDQSPKPAFRVSASSVPIPPAVRGRRATPYAWHDQRLGGESPLWRLMAPTTSQRQLLRCEAGGKEARGEIATLGTHGAPACWLGAARCACEAGRSGRASGLRRSPMSIKGPSRRRGGCARKAVGLIRGDLHGCLLMPGHAWRVRRVVRDGGVREGAARRGEVSRGQSTGGIVGRWEGPNAKPSAKTFVLVVVALTVANPLGGLAGKV